MKHYITSFFLLFITFGALAQQKPAYKIYSSSGKAVSYSKMLKALIKQDIVLFGESHNNAISHWLELELAQSLHASRPLILGAEMLEADNQLVLNQYLTGSISYKQLDTLARLWPNYRTDYAPVVDFAKANKLPFIATNIPRRYARLVHHNGFEILDSLPDTDKQWMAPLPMPFDPNLPSYVEILEMMGEHGTPELVKAQATKDATMAHFILKNYEPGKLFYHLNGSFHSNNYEGILWYLKKARGDLKYATISTVSQADLGKLEADNHNLADFIIVVDIDMTTTY